MAACNIIRDDNSTVLYTEAPNGARSILFDDLVSKVRDTAQALPLWLASKTKKFRVTTAGPQLNSHRSELLQGLNDIQVKEPMVSIVNEGQQIDLDIENLEFTNLTPGTGPNSLTTMTAYARPVGGGQAIKVGRIRYRVKGPTLEIDSSLLAPLTTYRSGQLSGIKGLGIGSKLYSELFKYGLREGLLVTSSDNLSPESKGLWTKLTNLGLARKDGDKFILNSYPSNFDVNGEVSMATVLDFVDREGVESGVTLEDQTEIRNSMLGVNVKSSQDLLSRLKLGFFSEGYFAPTRASLNKTNLYNSEEITDILTDFELQSKIRDFTYKLEEVQEPILNDMYLDDTFMVVKDGTKNSIGKFNVQNPYLTEKAAVKVLGGIEIRSEFEEEMMANESTNFLQVPYSVNYKLRSDLFNKFSKHKPVAEVSIEEGQLVPVTTGTRDYMEQTVREPSSPKLEQSLDFITSLDESLWREAPKQITTLLKAASKDLRDIGVDAVNLLDKAKKKPIQETKNFLNAAKDFATEANKNTFDNLVREYDSFFDVQDDFKYRKPILAEGITKDNTFYIETEMTGPQAFVELGLVPVGPNLYKRVQNESKDKLIDAVMNHVFATGGYEVILPQEAFKPAGFDEDGTMNMAKMRDRDNALALRTSVVNFVEAEVKKLFLRSSDSLDTEDLQRYVLNFNIYNKSNDYSKFDVKPLMSKEFDMISDPVTNVGYLATDFIADFNEKIINEKQKGSEAYEDFYSNFTITRTGIDLINDDPISLTKMQPYLEENKDLVNYFRSHKGRKPLQEVIVEEPIRDLLFMRNYYTNYPTALKPFQGEFSELTPTTMAVNSKAPFIRTHRGVFEFLQGVGRVGLYGKLETNDNQFKRYDLSFNPPILDDVALSILKGTDKNIKDVTEIKNLYSEAEKQSIDNEHDNC